MSRLTLLLLVSGSLNAAALVAWLSTSLTAPPPVAAAPVAVDAPPAPSAPAALDSHIWADLAGALSAGSANSSTTPPSLPNAAFVARLRAEGFPLDMIRAILRQQLDDHFVDREAAIRTAHPGPPYWHRRYGTNTTHRDSGPERIALRNEKRALLRALLGDEAESPDERARRQRDYGAIPVEKVEQLIQLNTNFDDRHNDLRNQVQGLALPSDRATIAALRTERREAIAALLTPDELATYDLHSGDTATNLRTKLRWFRPAEDEFLALYTLQSDLESAHPPPGIATDFSPEQIRARNAQHAAAAADYETDIAAQLGPERYAEYQLVTSPAYKQMRDLTDRLDLPAETAADLTHSFNNFTAQAQAQIEAHAGNPSAATTGVNSLRAAFVEQLPPDLPIEARASFDHSIQRWIQSRIRQARPAPAPAPRP